MNEESLDDLVRSDVKAVWEELNLFDACDLLRKLYDLKQLPRVQGPQVEVAGLAAGHKLTSISVPHSNNNKYDCTYCTMQIRIYGYYKGDHSF